MSLRNLQHPASRIAVMLVCISCGVGAQTALAATVNIQPGANIPAVVAAHPAGTTFVIAAGTYRLTTPIVAKNGDVFKGPCTQAPCSGSQAILSGARLLTSFEHSGSYYYVTGQTQQGRVTVTSDKCMTGYAGCIYPEDLYFDNKPLLHVTSLSDVGPGKWYFNYSTHIIYFYDNPAGHKVETSVTSAAFAPGPANNVTIEGLTVEKFATPVMTGAIAGQGTGAGTTTQGANWTVRTNEIRLNHASGVKLNYGWHLGGNYIHDNGNLGVMGGFGGSTTPSQVLVQWNQISNNNYARVNLTFGGGGVKIAQSRGVIIRGNYVHDNLGAGLHIDTNNYNTLIENNTISNNWDGIAFEVSYSGTVRNNRLLKNGYIYPSGTTWLYQGQLLSSTSRNIEAYCNVAEISSQGGNGMSVIAQQRYSWENQLSTNNYYHHNTIIFDGDSGFMGGAYNPLSESAYFVNNRFDYNAYHFPSLSRKPLAWSSTWHNFSGFQTYGQEAHGTADTLSTKNVPNVVITAPSDQTSLSALTDITGKAGGATIDKVEFYVDWALKSTTAGDSFSFALNPTGMSAGAHTIAAMAYTSEGIRACHAITVNIP